jgi:hypothetical protein
MTRDEAVIDVQTVLGFKKVHAEKIIHLFQKYQTELELATVKPWFLLSEDSVFNTTAGENRVPLPSDFLQEYEDGALWYTPTDTLEPEVKLYKEFPDHLQKKYPRTASGFPTSYALIGKYFVMYPTPAEAYPIRMRYYAKAELLSTDIENAWLRHVPNLLIGRAGAELAASLRDWKAKDMFDSMAAGTMGLLAASEEARENANLDLQIGGPH